MRFGTKLALFLVGVLITVQAVTGFATYGLVRGTLIDQGKAQLTTAAGNFTDQLDAIARQMAAGVKILTLDYALRQAIAEHDHNTVVSALRNHGRRVGASRMLLVETDGTISADTRSAVDPKPEPFAFPALLDQATADGRVATVAVLHGEAVWLIVVPVLAPTPIAYVAAALPLDDALLARLRVLAGLPRATGLAIRTPAAGWQIVAGPIDAALARQLPAGETQLQAVPRIIGTPMGETIFLASTLATPPDSPAVAAVMAYPLSDALRPYQGIVAVVLTGLTLGLTAAILGAWIVARGVVRPLELLASHTRRIAAGDYTPPPKLRRRDEIGQLSAALGAMTVAIAEREAHILHQASHEPITGLPNRQTLTNMIDAGMIDARTTGARTTGAGTSGAGTTGADTTGADTTDANAPHNAAAVIVVGLVRLQEVANTVGRELAERVMHDAATRLATLLPGVTLGCVGERSFAALLPVCDPKGALAIGANLIAAFDKPYQEGDLAIDTAVAIGVALAPGHGTSAALLLRRAEIAQQTASHSTGRATVYRAEIDPHRPELLSLMSDLRHGLQHGELHLHYQPKLDLATRRINGAEAVIRWQHPTRGMIQPDSFVGLAEETGNIRHLTRWALRAGIDQAAAWQRQGLAMRVSVNLSVRDLSDTELPELLHTMLRAAGLPAAALVLEITESAIMGEPDTAVAVLRRLVRLGVALAIDDFGVGQSSLAYLRRLPVHELKIDKAFVLKLAQSADDQTIVRSVVELGHSLGYRVTAEGVEDAASLEILAEFGCDQVQGYAIARPLAPEALARFVAEWHARSHLAGTVP
jgi:EAL domain-containing protein (putative c-di-GMP-specific phosphodiesterase class I)/GGDEF domain-containing protein